MNHKDRCPSDDLVFASFLSNYLCRPHTLVNHSPRFLIKAVGMRSAIWISPKQSSEFLLVFVYAGSAQSTSRQAPWFANWWRLSNEARMEQNSLEQCHVLARTRPACLPDLPSCYFRSLAYGGGRCLVRKLLSAFRLSCSSSVFMQKVALSLVLTWMPVMKCI